MRALSAVVELLVGVLLEAFAVEMTAKVTGS